MIYITKIQKKKYSRIEKSVSEIFNVSIDKVRYNLQCLIASRKRWPKADISPFSNAFGMVIKTAFKFRHK